MTKDELKSKLIKQIELIDSIDFKIDETKTICIFYDLCDGITRLVAGEGNMMFDNSPLNGKIEWTIYLRGNGLLAIPKEDNDEL